MGVKFGLTLRKENGLRVLENRVLKGLIGLKRDEVKEGWTELHLQLYNLHSTASIIRVMK
jgi:hypothetical protein